MYIPSYAELTLLSLDDRGVSTYVDTDGSYWCESFDYTGLLPVSFGPQRGYGLRRGNRPA